MHPLMVNYSIHYPSIFGLVSVSSDIDYPITPKARVQVTSVYTDSTSSDIDMPHVGRKKFSTKVSYVLAGSTLAQPS